MKIGMTRGVTELSINNLPIPHLNLLNSPISTCLILPSGKICTYPLSPHQCPRTQHPLSREREREKKGYEPNSHPPVSQSPYPFLPDISPPLSQSPQPVPSQRTIYRTYPPTQHQREEGREGREGTNGRVNIMSEAPSVQRVVREERKVERGRIPHMSGSSILRRGRRV